MALAQDFVGLCGDDMRMRAPRTLEEIAKQSFTSEVPVANALCRLSSSISFLHKPSNSRIALFGRLIGITHACIIYTHIYDNCQGGVGLRV